jgi:hypothetical protein
MTTRTIPHPDTRMSSRTELASKWVQLISLAASCYNVGTILMTQLGYRLWARVGHAEFEDYHKAWWYGWRGIQPIAFPSGIVATLGALAQLHWRSPRVPSWMVWLNITALMQAWVMTAVWWGRWQGQLKRARQEDGSLDPLYRRLLTTHWLRVALFTAGGILQLWMAVKSFLARS